MKEMMKNYLCTATKIEQRIQAISSRMSMDLDIETYRSLRARHQLLVEEYNEIISTVSTMKKYILCTNGRAKI